MRTIAYFLLDPFNIFYLLVAASAILWIFKKSKLAKLCSVVTLTWFLVSSTPLVPVQLINSLESRYSPLYVENMDDIYPEYHIIVLGGGHGFDDRLPANSLLSQNAIGRLSEGIRLYRQLPNSKLILSGFSASGGTTQAGMLQRAAVLLGVDKDRTILQKEPGNTFEEAKVYANTFGAEHPVILVTSASHMPRAMMMFDRHGVNAAASPTNYKLKGSWRRKKFGLPSVKNMELMRSGMSEFVAILIYGVY